MKEKDAMKKLYWIALPALMVAVGLFASARCDAEVKCPWLNAATAGGVLGGEVQMTVTAPPEHGTQPHTEPGVYIGDQVRMDRFDVSCAFSRKTDSGVSSLGIMVKTMSDPSKEFAMHLASCEGATVALKGIGNEAVQCVLKNGSTSGEQMVIARVRDRAFILTIIRPPAIATPVAGDALRDDTRNMAEQIAGSLF